MCASTRSPTGWPWRSLMSLKLSMSRRQSDRIVPPARPLRDRLQALLKAPVVAEAGERIREREADRLELAVHGAGRERRRGAAGERAARNGERSQSAASMRLTEAMIAKTTNVERTARWSRSKKGSREARDDGRDQRKVDGVERGGCEQYGRRERQEAFVLDGSACQSRAAAAST